MKIRVPEVRSFLKSPSQHYSKPITALDFLFQLLPPSLFGCISKEHEKRLREVKMRVMQFVRLPLTPLHDLRPAYDSGAGFYLPANEKGVDLFWPILLPESTDHTPPQFGTVRVQVKNYNGRAPISNSQVNVLLDKLHPSVCAPLNEKESFSIAILICVGRRPILNKHDVVPAQHEHKTRAKKLQGLQLRFSLGLEDVPAFDAERQPKAKQSAFSVVKDKLLAIAGNNTNSTANQLDLACELGHLLKICVEPTGITL